MSRAAAIAGSLGRAPVVTVPVMPWRERLLDVARQEIGKPYSGPIVGQPESYRWGDPGWDCSSFVSGAVKKATGITLTAFTDAAYDQTIATALPLAGDIVFYRYLDRSQPGVTFPHMGFWLSDSLTLDCRYPPGCGEHPHVAGAELRIRRLPLADSDWLPLIDASSPAAFVASVKPYAERVSAETGLPAAIMIAMAINETGYGRYALGNNFFGIKADSNWTGPTTGEVGTWEDYGNGPVQISDVFRAYPDPADSFRDFARFLQENRRYAAAWIVRAHPEAFIQAIIDAGYATDPQYVSKILRIARSWQLL